MKPVLKITKSKYGYNALLDNGKEKLYALGLGSDEALGVAAAFLFEAKRGIPYLRTHKTERQWRALMRKKRLENRK